MMNEIKSRNSMFDLVKINSIFIVFTTHFIAKFDNSMFELWSVLPFSLVLKGITGKLGVTFFAVLSGYFAYKKGKKGNEKIVLFLIKRYVYFFICCLFANCLYFLLGKYEGNYEEIKIIDVIINSVLLNDAIFPTFWFIKYFFIFSIISFAIGNFVESKLLVFALILFFIVINRIWISIGLFGIYVDWLRKIYNKYKIFYSVLLFIFLLLIKQNESKLIYIFDGIFAALILSCINDSKYVKKNLALNYIGNKTMEILMIHPLIFDLFFIKYTLTNNLLLLFVVSLIATFILSIPMNYLVKSTCSFVNQIIDNIFMNIEINKRK